MANAASIADTIVAQSSAHGASLRALLRISGDAAQDALAVIGVPRVPPHRSVVSCVLSFASNRRLACPAWLLWMPGTNTFTGQPTAEILMPGSAALVDRVLRELCQVPGVRLAEPGEFSARGYIAGRMTLSQAEGLAALIAAQNRDQLQAARTLCLDLAPYETWYEEALMLLALIEAGIDFTDQEDVVAISPAQLAQRTAELARAIRAFLGASQGCSLRTAEPVVSLVGAPNAGKSTLLNALLGRPRAVASPHAGTTRDVLREPLDLATIVPGAGTIVLQDCPGFEPQALSRDGLREINVQAQRSAQAALLASDCILWCDPQGVFDEARLAQIAALPLAAITALRPRMITVRTCADRPGSVQPPSRQPLPSAISVSAVAGTGLRALAERLAATLSADVQAGVGAVLPRHRVALTRALSSLESVRDQSALHAHKRALPHAELLAAEMREAAGALGVLCGGTGSISPDEVLGKIFGAFCIGK